jgi:hypothetical protein
MSEKTLSILGVIKKKLDSLDRGPKNKAPAEDLNNEFDYVIPSTKSNKAEAEQSKENQGQLRQESKMEPNYSEASKIDSSLASASLPSQSNEGSSEMKFDFSLNFGSDDNSPVKKENPPVTKNQQSSETNNPVLANLGIVKNSHNQIDDPSDSEFDFEIENIIEEYEDELSDEDLDGGVSSSSIYNLYIKKQNNDENFISNDLAINTPEISKESSVNPSESSVNSSHQSNDLNLSFADDLSIAEEKLFGNSSLNNSSFTQPNIDIIDQAKQNNQSNLADTKKAEVTLFSKLSSQINNDKLGDLNSKNIDQKTFNKDDHSELDFHDDLHENIDLKNADLNNLNIDNNLKIEDNDKSNKDNPIKEDLAQQNNKKEIDLEFEKELNHLDSDVLSINEHHENKILASNPDLNNDVLNNKSSSYDQKMPSENLTASPINAINNEQIKPLTPDKDPPAQFDNELEIASEKLFGINQGSNFTNESNAEPLNDSINLVSIDNVTSDQSQLLSANNLAKKNDNDILGNAQQNQDIAVNNSFSQLSNQQHFDNNKSEIKTDLHDLDDHNLFDDNQHLDHDYHLEINKPILHEDVILQSSNSIQKLLDAKSMMSGISNFMQSPYPIEIAVQLMEPKLERWINENLAQIVEKVVREEISKIIPKN